MKRRQTLPNEKRERRLIAVSSVVGGVTFSPSRGAGGFGARARPASFAKPASVRAAARTVRASFGERASVCPPGTEYLETKKLDATVTAEP